MRLPEQNDPDLAPLAATFNATIDALEHRVKQDARFAGDVSHELRSPLTTMVNAVEVLQHRRETFDSAAGQAVDLLVAEIDHFQLMVVDLLEISRAEQDDDDRALELLDLTELVDKVSGATPGCPRPVVDDEPASVVVSDRRRLVRLVANLLDNANRHGGGVVRLAVSTHADVRGSRSTTPDPACRPNSDNRFSSDSPASVTTPTMAAAVLGWPWFARHVGLHHGSVWVEDRPGGGARFVVELPRALGRSPRSPDAAAVTSLATGRVGTHPGRPTPFNTRPEKGVRR